MKNYKITNMSKNGKKLLNLGKYILVGSLVVSSITACVKDDEVDTTLSTSDYSMEQTVETSATPGETTFFHETDHAIGFPTDHALTTEDAVHYSAATTEDAVHYTAEDDAQHYMDENGNIIFPTDHALTPEDANTFDNAQHYMDENGNIIFPTDHPLDKVVNETTAQHYINQNGNVDFPTEHGIGFPTEHGIGFPTEHGIGFPTEHALTSGDGAQHYMDENGNLINSGDDAQHYMNENGNGLRKSL